MLPPLPPTPAAAAAALASPGALPALVDAILSGCRCRDGGVQVRNASPFLLSLSLSLPPVCARKKKKKTAAGSTSPPFISPPPPLFLSL